LVIGKFEIGFVVVGHIRIITVVQIVVIGQSCFDYRSPSVADRSLGLRTLGFHILFRIDFAKSWLIQMDFQCSVEVNEFQTQIHHYFNPSLVLDLVRSL
jgi:hypothetical protein